MSNALYFGSGSNTYQFSPPPKPLTANSHSLDDFICMTPDKGPGTVYSLQEFVYVFYKLPNTQLAQSNNENKA